MKRLLLHELPLLFFCFVGFSSFWLSGCEQERIIVQEREKYEKALDTQKEDAAEQMEIELARKQRFYEALKGAYEGEIQLPEGKKIVLRFVLIPAVPPVLLNLNRVRSYDEIKADLEKLSFNVQIVQHPSWANYPEPCQIEKIQPDFTRGEINIASEQCPGFYILRLADFDSQSEENSTLIAKNILEGKIATMPILYGQSYLLTHPSQRNTFTLTAIGR